MTVLFNNKVADVIDDRFAVFSEENCNVLLNHGNNHYHHSDYYAIIKYYNKYDNNRSFITLDDITDDIYENESLLTNVLWAINIAMSDYSYEKVADKFKNYSGDLNDEFIAIMKLYFNDNGNIPRFRNEIPKKYDAIILMNVINSAIVYKPNYIHSLIYFCLEMAITHNLASEDELLITMRDCISDYVKYCDVDKSDYNASRYIIKFISHYPQFCTIDMLSHINYHRYSSFVPIITIIRSNILDKYYINQLKYNIININLVDDYISAFNEINKPSGILSTLSDFTHEEFYRELPDDYKLGVII